MTTPSHKPQINNAHLIDLTQLESLLDVDPHRGLSADVARYRLRIYGHNTLPQKQPPTLLQLFFAQFANPLLLILVVATILAFLLGHHIDGIIVLLALVINGAIGAYQERHAEETLALLQKKMVAQAQIIRDGKPMVIDSDKVVPGDLLVLSAGDSIVADARLVMSDSLLIDEAMLTGESVPVQKDHTAKLDPDTPIAEQVTMVHQGTYITSGSGRAIVVRTGTATEFGTIAHLLEDTQEEAPLQKKINHLTERIIIITLGMSAVLFVYGIATGRALADMLLVTISLLVSVIPEGLPIAITAILVHGIARMSKKHMLVKQLAGVQTLGHTNIIAVDKTGTITKNELSITSIYAGGGFYRVSGSGYERYGDITNEKGASIDPKDHFALRRLAQYGALSANAQIMRNHTPEGEQITVTGDPTEAAFLVLGEKLGFNQTILRQKWPLVDEIPFHFEHQYYANTHLVNQKNLLIVTGSPEAITKKCTHMSTQKSTRSLGPKTREKLREIASEMQGKGLRVLALAIRQDAPQTIHRKDVSELTLVGYVGMIDTLRSQAPKTIARLRTAGIRAVMITGDAPATATSIAQEAGIYTPGDTVLTGKELEKLSNQDLVRALSTTSVFARITPEEKLTIVSAYKKAGDTIAMTGDGINDAPALAAAHLGIAMGKTGTAVAQASADVVLLDDSLDTLVGGVREGRKIFANIQRMVTYLLSTNAAEFLVIMLSILLVFPIPLVPAQIIWMNLVTDSFLAIGLGLQQGKARNHRLFADDEVLDKKRVRRIVQMALVLSAITLGVFFLFLASHGYVYATTMALTTLIFSQLWNAWTLFIAGDWKQLRSITLGSPMVQATTAVIILHIAVLAIPGMRNVLSLAQVPLLHILLAGAIGALVIPADMLYRKFLTSKKS